MSEATPEPETPESPSSAAWAPPSLEAMHASLPQYEFVKVLGRGGMGVVYQARQITLDRFVAIKVLPAGVEDDEIDFRERFITEARSMARLSHPSIVHVHDFGATPEGLLYFVMEYVEGTNLEDVLQAKGHVPPKLAVHLMGQICDALAYAHEHDLIHRDVKPSNILVDTEGRVRVADFGLAQEGVGLDNGPSMGTPEYAAPELTRTGVPIDHRVDLYALGVMLYQMLSGDVPRGEFLPVSMMKPDVDRRFDKIILKAMAWDLHQRYASAVDIKADLEAALLPPGTRREGSVADEKEKKKELPPFQAATTRRRGAPAIVVFAPWVIVAGLVALAFTFIRKNDDGPPPDVDPSAARPVFGAAPVTALPSGGTQAEAAPQEPAAEEPPTTPAAKAEPKVAQTPVGERPPDDFWKSGTAKPTVKTDDTPKTTAAAEMGKEGDSAMAAADGPSSSASTASPASSGPPQPTVNTTTLPPVSDLVMKRVAELQKEFEAAREVMLNQAYYPRANTLKQQYEAALQRVLDAARATSDTDTGAAVEAEIRSLADDGRIPTESGPDTPVELQKLRTVYLKERAAIRDSLPGLLRPLYDSYVQKLEKLHGDLVQVGRAGDARHVEVTLEDIRSAQASLGS